LVACRKEAYRAEASKMVAPFERRWLREVRRLTFEGNEPRVEGEWVFPFLFEVL